MVKDQKIIFLPSTRKRDNIKSGILLYDEEITLFRCLVKTLTSFGVERNTAKKIVLKEFLVGKKLQKLHRQKIFNEVCG